MDEKCSICGRKADFVVKVYSMGFSTCIAYCRECLQKTLNDFQRSKRKPDLNVWALINSRPKLQTRLEFSKIDAFSLLNKSLKEFFGTELRSEERMRYNISRLRNEMTKAIKDENYELAGILKREIEQLESNFKKAK